MQSSGEMEKVLLPVLFEQASVLVNRDVNPVNLHQAASLPASGLNSMQTTDRSLRIS